ncbi:MAG: glycosyltransferase, partial [Halobacteriovoraceae bacterium]|nr:glycosyltransferase [Halobacteriovoraceae bacterium]
MTDSATTIKHHLLLITLRSDLGGGPRHVSDLTGFLKKQKKFQTYIASPLESPYGGQFQAEGYAHFELPHRRFSLFKLLQLLVFCHKHQIKTVHSHGRGAGAYSRFLTLFNIKVIHTFHGVHAPKNFADQVKLYLDKILNVFTHKNIFVSTSEFKQAQNLGLTMNQNFQIISNGLNLSNDDTHLEDQWDQYRTHQNSILVGCLTRLDEHKGNKYLIGYFRKLPEHFILLIAGDGPEKDELKKMIDDYGLSHRIHLLGNVSEPDHFLRSIDILTSASKSEGLPYAMLEAMALKVP